MKIRNVLTTPPQHWNPLFAYGFLVILVLLSIWIAQLWWSAPPSYPYDRYSNLVLMLMLVLNHLAFQFRWPPRVMAALRVLALGWCVFGSFYIFYWSHILFPLKQASP